MKNFEKKFFPLSINNVLLFAFIWLMTGFATGAFILLGPVRIITNLFTASGAGDWVEKITVKLIILLFVLVSAFISLIFVKVILNTPNRFVRFGIPLLCFFATAGSLFAFMHPNMLSFLQGEKLSTADARFVFGPYPTEEILQKIKQEGITAVICLLHPAVVPFEPALIEKEKNLVQKVGLEFIHIPMLPWISENTKAIERIKSIAKHPKGRYYVHCYLGQDRVNIVKRILDQAGTSNVSIIAKEKRSIESIEHFERGKIIKLSDGVYFTPYPTDEEFSGYVLNGNVKQIVSLLDTQEPSDVVLIEKEKKISSVYNIPVEFLPLKNSVPFDSQQILEAARRVWSLPRPVLVHKFRTDSPQAQAFAQAFRTDLPPLPPLLFDSPMQGGALHVIAPNIAVGPRPAGPEFGNYLFARGVRNFVYLGAQNSQEAAEDKKITNEAGLDWQSIATITNEFETELASGETWYLYGPLLSALEEELEKKFGPAVPDVVVKKNKF